MRRILLLAALAAFSGVSAASLPDTVTRDGVAYARRGSLGANAYVATNVVVSPPAYQLSRVAEMKLRDRCVNYASVAGTNAVFALPGRKTTAGCARAFILYLDALDAGAAPCHSRARPHSTRPTGRTPRASAWGSGCSRSSRSPTTNTSSRRGSLRKSGGETDGD